MLRKQDALLRNRLPLLCGVLLHWLSDKGIVSMLVSFHMGLIGLQMLAVTSDTSTWRLLARYLSSCGMFGFVGGCTNWLAIALFFRRIPLVCGSGYVQNTLICNLKVCPSTYLSEGCPSNDKRKLNVKTKEFRSDHFYYTN